MSASGAFSSCAATKMPLVVVTSECIYIIIAQVCVFSLSRRCDIMWLWIVSKTKSGQSERDLMMC